MKLQRYIIFSLFFLGGSANFLFGQTLEEQMTKSHPNCETMLMNAMDVLPKLYRGKLFDSLDKAVDIWERSCTGMPELRITRILLNMEESRFNLSQDVDVATLDLLSDYARFFPSTKEPKSSFHRFSSVWARLLLENKKLDENEKFICKVLTGDINDPEKEIKRNAQTYPEFNEMLEKKFEAQRKELRGDIAFTTGVWIPTNNLSTLGVHPSFGFQLGVRNEHHQLDLTLQFRYLYSANTYAVNRDGQLDSTDYYFGGYIGLDYAYYLVSKPRFDIGLMAGMGWDGFDFAPQPYDYYYPYPYYTDHVTIGSFNANAGVRFNYYFTHSFYLALQGRYNAIQYSTHGGSDLSGDAVSIDLIFGFSGSKSWK